MKHFFQFFLFICIFSYRSNAQSAPDTGFAAQKQHIDSLVSLTESNKMLTNNLFLGSLVWGSFNANIFYMVGSQKIDKAEYFFKEGNAGKKIFYYDNNSQLIKIN